MLTHAGAELWSEAMSHTRAVLSREALTTRVPSALKLAELTSLLCLRAR